jgi:hypothetical protein
MIKLEWLVGSVPWRSFGQESDPHLNIIKNADVQIRQFGKRRAGEINVMRAFRAAGTGVNNTDIDAVRWAVADYDIELMVSSNL